MARLSARTAAGEAMPIAASARAATASKTGRQKVFAAAVYCFPKCSGRLEVVAIM